MGGYYRSLRVDRRVLKARIQRADLMRVYEGSGEGVWSGSQEEADTRNCSGR